MLHLNFHPFPVLHTERLLLRRVEATDAPVVHALRTDERVNAFLDRPRPASIADTQAFIQKLIAGMDASEGIHWIITLKDDDRVLGSLGFFNLSPEDGQAEFGYELHPNFQGRGIMQEAVARVLEFGFAKVKLRKIVAMVVAENLPSVRLLERNGFTLDQSRDWSEQAAGDPHELIVYSLTRTAYSAGSAR